MLRVSTRKSIVMIILAGFLTTSAVHAETAPTLRIAGMENPESLAGVVRLGDERKVRDLLDAGADPNAVGQSGLTPIFYAIYRDDAGMLRLLLEKGATPTGANRYGMSPVELAYRRAERGSFLGDLSVLIELVRADREAEKEALRLHAQKEGEDAAESSSCEFYVELIRFVSGDDDYPPELMREWIRKGVECASPEMNSILAHGHEWGKYGLPVDFQEAARHYAQSGNGAKVEELAGREIEAIIARRDGEDLRRWLSILPASSPVIGAPWMESIARNDLESVIFFHNAGVDINLIHGNRTALMTAIFHGDVDLVEWLLHRGADPSASTLFGTALTVASARGRTEIARLLIDLGASLEAENDTLSPLAAAVRGGHVDAARLLLERGAVFHEFPDGRTLFDVARSNQDLAMKRLLFQAPQAPISSNERRMELERLNVLENRETFNQRWLAGDFMVRLDGEGNPLPSQTSPFEEAPWSCAHDEMSGLTWIVKDHSGGLHDKDRIFYIWGIAGDDCENDDCNILAYVDLARRQNICGFSDWEVPSVTHLETLAYPHAAQAFPHHPGSVLWGHLENSGVYVVTSGLLGQSVGHYSFGNGARALLVRGEMTESSPLPSNADFSLLGFEPCDDDKICFYLLMKDGE